MDNKFCPNCGAKLEEGALFCDNCGFNLASLNEENDTASNADEGSNLADNQMNNTESNAGMANNSANNNAMQAAPVRRAVRKPSLHRKRNTIVTIIVIILVLLGIGGYVFGNHYYSKSATLNRAMDSLVNDSNTDSYFTTNSSKIKINDSSMSALSKYVNANKDNYNSVKNALSSKGVSPDGNLTYKRNGNKWLLFPKYQVEVSPVNPSITTNHDDSDVQINNKDLGKANSTDSFSLGYLVPGTYDIKVSNTFNGKKLVNNQDAYLGDNSAIDLPLTTISFTVNAGPNADVYVNDKKIGTADDSGDLKVSNLPYSSQLNMYGVIHADGKDTRSDKYSLTKSDDDNDDIKLNYPGAVDPDDAQNTISDYLNGIANQATSDDDDDDDSDSDFDASDYFIDADSNKDNQDFIQWAKDEKKNDDVNSITIDVKVKNVVPNGDNSTVTGTLNYDFSGDDGDHIQVFEFTSNMKKSGDSAKMQSLKTTKKIKDYNKNDDD